jgi:hypothetical protein
MALMARLSIQSEHLPLGDRERAMLVKSLQDFISDLSPTGRFADGNIAEVYIQAPELPMVPPIFSDNCGRLR